MGQGVLTSRPEFGESPAAALIGDEHRVVAEPARTACTLRDPAVDVSLGGHLPAVGPPNHRHGTEAGAPVGDADHAPEQFRHILLVRGLLAGIAGAVDPGCATEGADLEAGVVGDGRETGGRRQGRCLQPGVLLQGGARLLHLGDVGRARPQFGVRERLGHDRPDLLGLVRIGRSEDEDHRGAGGSASTAACASRIRPIPAVARSSNSSSSARLNGAPSAVPWTSTKPPADVITTFMSVSARESSL